jgi:hypothetical protein
MHFQRNGTSGPIFYALLLFALTAFSAVNFSHAATPATLPKGSSAAQPSATAPPPDVIVLSDGDRIFGTFVREVGGKVTFHSAILGDLVIPSDNIKELRTGTKMAVIDKGVVLTHGHIPSNLPIGTLTIQDNMITVHPDNNAMIQPIPLANAQYIVDQATLNKQALGRPGFLQGWNGAATASLTLVEATQKQYGFSGSLGLVRVAPTVDWLTTNNRTAFDYSESYGKITQPAYIAADGTAVPSTFTKSSILHADAERDEYVSSRLYYLGTASFDHNYSQSLQLQQIYGGGLGYTVIKTPIQELDLKAVVQFERQAFFNVTPPSPSSQNLIASTFGGSYLRHVTKGMLFAQQLLYIPAWNDVHAYSFNESDTLAFPAYKNFGFSLGTLDTYLNDVPLTFPNTKRNSFQFTAGVTYTIKSSY